MTSARAPALSASVTAKSTSARPAKAPVSVYVTLQTSRPDGPLAKVDVIDQGPGIPENILPHVFDRFVTGAKQAGGLGLGLYLAKRIAGVHGGDLSVESQPGKGARFSLTLPLSREKPAIRAEAPAASPQR